MIIVMLMIMMIANRTKTGLNIKKVEIRGKKLHHVGSLFFNLDTLHKIEESMLKVNIMVIITNSSIIMVIITTSIYLLDDNHISR